MLHDSCKLFLQTALRCSVVLLQVSRASKEKHDKIKVETHQGETI